MCSEALIHAFPPKLFAWLLVTGAPGSPNGGVGEAFVRVQGTAMDSTASKAPSRRGAAKQSATWEGRSFGVIGHPHVLYNNNLLLFSFI